MSDVNLAKSLVEDIKELRIERQYKCLLDWDKNLITGAVAINRILDEEHLTYFPGNAILMEFLERKHKKKGVSQ